MRLVLILVSALSLTVTPVIADTFSLAPVGGGAAAGAEVDLVKVRGKGVGATKAEALKDAYRDAVERAVGMFVDAEQMVKNDELLKDQVLTQSNAYIEKCDVVKESSENGLVKVSVLASVRKRALVTKMSGFMPIQNVALGSTLQNAHAQIVTKEQRGRDGAALLKNALSGVDPVRMLIKPSLRPESQKITKGGAGDFWKGGPIPEGKVGLSYVFKLELDTAKYFSEFIPKLKQILGQISLLPPKEFRITAMREQNDSPALQYRNDYLKGKRNTCMDVGIGDGGFYLPFRRFSGFVGGRKYIWGRDCNGHYFDEQNDAVGIYTRGFEDLREKNVTECQFILVTELAANNMNGKAVRYVLGFEEAKCLNGWLRDCGCLEDYGRSHEIPNKINYEIVFKDANGGDVAVFPWQVGRGALANVGAYPEHVNDKGTTSRYRYWFYVSPFVGCAGGSFVQWRDFILEKDDLAKIASVSIEPAD
ncbi:MAG: hypothetical protein MJ240_03175 [Kiritimatiellae bacterium]|nr:hypothetical protein [Kiritimatiellia bacterium]